VGEERDKLIREIVRRNSLRISPRDEESPNSVDCRAAGCLEGVRCSVAFGPPIGLDLGGHHGEKLLPDRSPYFPQLP